MARQVDWSDLRTGIITAIVLGLVITATLLFARVGTLHGKKVTLYVVTDDATGVLAGTEVWLAGQKTGLVTDVRFRPPSSDTLERLVLTMQFLRKALPNVRRDSYVQVQPGGSLIGTPVVYISAGSTGTPQLQDGDTLRTRSNPVMANVTAQIGQIRPAVSALASDLKVLNDRITQPTGTVGAFRAYGFPAMPEFGARLTRLTGKVSNGSGTIALATRRNLMARASRVMSQSDSIRALLGSNNGSLGRFQRDSTLMKKAGGVMAELDTLRGLAGDPMGSIGRAHPDSGLVRELARSRVLLDSLMQDVKKHPTRYIRF
ncbi:MAG TPA: MlaD family protein [Gemmatimonadaceae bacterium]|jgi:phospholipid/cholesterol/gamma-HCH transport system substrate-binding protein